MTRQKAMDYVMIRFTPSLARGRSARFPRSIARANQIWLPTVSSTPFCDEPYIIGFCSNGWNDTVRNIKQTGQFVWNLTTRQCAAAMNPSSASVPHDIDEFCLSGLTKEPGVRVDVYRVKESPVSLECRLTQIVQLLNSADIVVDAWMVFGEAVYVHINQDLIIDGVYRTALAHPILRGGGDGEYAEVRAEALFSMPAPA
jgi:flavin reductase (DIM6/NTAB) family NADH-FMN oxidoreductase RutF